MVSSGVVMCLSECPYYIKSYSPARYDNGVEIFQCVTVCDGKVY